MMKKPDFLHVDTNSLKLNILVSLVINGCAHSGCRILKLAVSHEEINEINWFLVCRYKFRKA